MKTELLSKYNNNPITGYIRVEKTIKLIAIKYY